MSPTIILTLYTVAVVQAFLEGRVFSGKVLHSDIPSNVQIKFTITFLDDSRLRLLVTTAGNDELPIMVDLSYTAVPSGDLNIRWTSREADHQHEVIRRRLVGLLWNVNPVFAAHRWDAGSVLRELHYHPLRRDMVFRLISDFWVTLDEIHQPQSEATWYCSLTSRA
ncbi:hypothetical protein FOL47_009851 [Perkinsus chesapeaki]|uniref:Uncharacterized protein n=1 Tax=Perkinsus chesapeaki TaxID=330153 RepID=A0A7J6L661_PERCH|nr:hypothetical protein FOL47_009851 [Perkinsus chesapeaki]